MSEQGFVALLQRARAGDQDAAAALVKLCDERLQGAARSCLRNPRLRRQFDSADLCQAVLGDFFTQIAEGQFHLDSAEELYSLLSRMARNKMLKQRSRCYAAKRDIRRNVDSSVEDLELSASQETPADSLTESETLRQIHDRLSPRERYVIDQRLIGRSWADLAHELGGSSDRLRMSVSRALKSLIVAV